MMMNPLPPSSKTVLRILGTEGALTHKDIVKKSHCSPRTVRFALKRLKEHSLIIEKLNMRDMRQIIYIDRRVLQQDTGKAESWPGNITFPDHHQLRISEPGGLQDAHPRMKERRAVSCAATL